MSFFNKEKGSNSGISKRRGSYQESAVTILTSGCHFTGKLYCKGSSRIGGKVEGEITSEGLLIIEEPAVIHADVKAEEIILHGIFTGRLTATGKVEITESSSFEGEVNTPSLLIKEGARFNGHISMPKDDAKANFIGIDELQKKKLASKDATAVTN